ncbi:MAG: hypothetical protein ABSD74_05805 [Rhizomicrobium sp.]
MKDIEHLQTRWRDSVRFRGLHANLMLEKDGLVLGANTRLAKRNADGALDIERNEARVLTLLSVAYGRPVNASILNALSGASKHARGGDDALAAMHIALAGLPRLPDLNDASRRLFIADGLLEAGVEPRDVFATRQVKASQGRPVIWIFAERDAALYVNNLFHSDEHPLLNRIEVLCVPWKEGMK